jgi:hypothetical protein
MAVPRTAVTASLTHRKTLAPAGTTKMKKATRSWRPMPQARTRTLTTLRFEEKSQATPARRKIPAKLTRL